VTDESPKIPQDPLIFTTSPKQNAATLASGRLAGRPDTTATFVFRVPVPCLHKTPLREQITPVPVQSILSCTYIPGWDLLQNSSRLLWLPWFPRAHHVRVCWTEQLLRPPDAIKFSPYCADFRFKNAFDRKVGRKLALRSRILFASTEVMHRPGSDSFLHFDIKNTYQIHMTNKMIALNVCFPQPYSESSDGRRFAASRARLNYYQTISPFPREQFR